ncbi:MAG: molecular chaperone [Methylococcales bacterium]|nr:molecular chaperone [Methylococcales bacterium]MDP3837747.1 molecular chaperone [Methylococcales bacterium]
MKIQTVSSRTLGFSLISILIMGIGCVCRQLQQHARQLIYGLVLLVGTSVVSAGSFQVSPVRATLSSGKPISAMTVRNTGTAPAVIQLEVMTWSQQQGKDIYTPTQEILATPPIFTIPVGGSQILRIGLRRTPDAQRELTYRLFLQEVPPPPKPDFKGLQVALRIGVPVFVTPTTVPQPALAWKVYRTRDGKIEVNLTNNGGLHVQVSNIRLARVDGGELGKQQLSGYVLPNQSNSWQVKDVSVPSSVSTLHLFAKTDGGEVDAGVLTVESK